MKPSASRRQFLAAGLALPATHALNPTAPPAPAAAGKVQYRKLGRTGLQISSVGLGCMITADASVLARAVDMGINHFDTARVYQGGNNEYMVGSVLQPHRKNVILSTKTKATNQASAMKNLEESLRALKTDYLDIWYLHDRRAAAEINDDVVEALLTAKQQGKIRFTGATYHTAHAELTPVVVKNGKLDVVLLTYNFAMQGKLDREIKMLADAGLGIIAMKVMAGSFGADPSYDYRKSRDTLKREGASLAALKWALKNPNIHCAIPSTTDTEQLEENFRAMSEPYTDQEKQLLAAQLDYIRPLYCRACGSCAGACPKGYPVEDVLRFLMYAEGYGQFSLGRERFLSMPSGMQAVKCSECAECKVRCPNGVRVSQRLIRAQELLA